MRQRRAQQRVDDDADRPRLDADLLEPETVHDGNSTDAEQEPVAHDPAAAREHDARPARFELGPLDGRAGDHLDALLLEVAPQQLRQLGILERREPRAALDDRHTGAETSVDLRELERDRAGAEADEVLRQLGHVQQVVARHVGDGVEARDLGNAGPSAGGDQRALELDPLAAALDRVLGEKPRVPAEEGDAVIFVDLVLVEGDAVVDHALDARHHRGEVNLDRPDPDAELLGSADVLCDFGGPDQGFGRDAPARDSGAADEAALEQRDPLAALPGGAHAGPASHPGADHRHVEALARHR